MVSHSLQCQFLLGKCRMAHLHVLYNSNSLQVVVSGYENA